MSMRTQESLLVEFANIRNKISKLCALVDGRKYLEGIKYSTEQQRNHSVANWVHLAHRGTLEKIQVMLCRDGIYEAFELLAIARNIFENLVWLRLMSADINYGLVFYAHLLRGQKEHCNSYIQKMTEEAELFDAADTVDRDAGASAMTVFNSNLSPEEQGDAYRTMLDEQTAILDDMVRREFSLYAKQAEFNGYGFQAHLIRTEAIPACESQLAEIISCESILNADLPIVLDARLQNIAVNKWNWFERAREANMEKHYRFVYGYTSRLLHSTPINIITSKSLTDDEKSTILDYIVISSGDILTLIEKFNYPGMAEMMLYQLGDEPAVKVG